MCRFLLPSLIALGALAPLGASALARPCAAQEQGAVLDHCAAACPTPAADVCQMEGGASAEALGGTPTQPDRDPRSSAAARPDAPLAPARSAILGTASPRAPPAHAATPLFLRHRALLL